MSAIRTLIEAHKTAMRATTYAEDEKDVDRLATFEARTLDVLVAEPARSMDAVQAKVRYLRESDDIVGALGGNPNLLRSLLDSFIYVDPVVYSIDNHRRLRKTLDEIEDADSPAYAAAQRAEAEAWRRLLLTTPQTLDGATRFAQHVAAHPDIGQMVGRDGSASALSAIAAALARLGGAA